MAIAVLAAAIALGAIAGCKQKNGAQAPSPVNKSNIEYLAPCPHGDDCPTAKVDH